MNQYNQFGHPHGPWKLEEPLSDFSCMRISEGEFVNGKRHGRWTINHISYANGIDELAIIHYHMGYTHGYYRKAFRHRNNNNYTRVVLEGMKCVGSDIGPCYTYVTATLNKISPSSLGSSIREYEQRYQLSTLYGNKLAARPVKLHWKDGLIERITELEEESLEYVEAKYNAQGEIITYKDNNGNWYDNQLMPYPCPYEPMGQITTITSSSTLGLKKNTNE